MIFTAPPTRCENNKYGRLQQIHGCDKSRARKRFWTQRGRYVDQTGAGPPLSQESRVSESVESDPIIWSKRRQQKRLNLSELCWKRKHFSKKEWKLKYRKPWRNSLPVQAVDHVPHGADEMLVVLGVTDDDAVELLHIRVDGFKGGGLSAAYKTGNEENLWIKVFERSRLVVYS